MLYSVLTVTGRHIDLEPLAKALASQINAPRTEWIVVDAHWPVKKKLLLDLHRTLLFKWRLVYAPAPDSWVRENGYRYLASIRNESLRLAGGSGPTQTICFPIDDDLMPVSPTYLSELGAAVKRGFLPVPGIDYGHETKRHPSGNAATPFQLDLALGENGYDELFDANWPGTSTYEDVDLCFRLKTHGLKVEQHSAVLKQLPIPSGDSVANLKGLKCNHALRVAASPLDFGGSGLNWETNEGPPSAPVKRLWSGCQYLDREKCVFLGRRCEVDLGVARFGHEDLDAFLDSRPKFNLLKRWLKSDSDRRVFTIGRPLTLDVAI